MKKSSFVFFIFIAVLMILSLNIAMAQKPITLIFTSHNSGSGFWKTNCIEPYFIELEKRTNGRVKVEQHWNGELVSLIDAYDALIKGSVDLAEYFPSMLQGRFPMDDVVVFTPYDTLCFRPGRVLHELGQEFPQMLEPYSDARLLWREPGGSYGIVTTKKQIRTLEGSKGMKIGPVGKWSSKVIEALGWVPTPVPPEDSTSALQTGVQEGTGISMYLLWEFGWGPIMKYMTLPTHCDEMLVNCSLNLDVWNKLPKDIQDIMNGMTDWIIDLQDKAVLTNLHESLPKAETEFGIVTYWLPPEEVAKFTAATQSVQQEFISDLESQGLPGKKLVDRFLELNKKYSDEKYKPY
ncbi:MAG: TRAP transporter substrate-binding protein DctP [Deltaproteobacteria bacterium]|nr:TRAP transporter substrate-binding protein DctP [Deltaproteobacteria bacterium]